jgi:hypothetical protein
MAATQRAAGVGSSYNDRSDGALMERNGELARSGVRTSLGGRGVPNRAYAQAAGSRGAAVALR